MATSATESELITALHDLADELGKAPTAAQMHERGKFSPWKYQQEFGRWNDALRQSGLGVNQRRATDKTVQDFINDLQQVAETVGRTPRRGDVDEHGEWDVTTYQERVPANGEKSRWNTVLTTAGFEPYYQERETIEKECETCGEVMVLKEYRSDRRFCSYECHGKYRKGRYMGRDNWAYNSVEVQCGTCGRVFDRIKSLAQQRDNHFCDHECYGTWISKNVVGEEHPRWKDKVASYGAGWNEEKREKVRERDNRQCQACGKTEVEELDDLGRKLSVHHITPASQFDDPLQRNAMDNLVTLCHSHHMMWEGIPLKPTLLS